MPKLNFQVEGVQAIALAATPQLTFRLRIDDTESADSCPIESILLRIQIRIEPTKRSHPLTARAGLNDLFGEPARWGASMRSMLWTHANLIVPRFQGTAMVDLPIECTYDFNVGATKYFSALDDGDIPLCFLFSGTVFYQTDGGLQAAPISWEQEATYRLPVGVWREMMALYYPNRVWLCLDKDAFDRLDDYKSSQSLCTWEQSIEKLLAHAAPQGAAGN
ncbi:MAG TPA: DUF6084 family protein [Pirellulales bacterium]|jgi:hypothetical protein|nr:DUF6084 family protein [Pirellulales bacterium]